jgi:CheY-like chemotaxis protein
MCRAVDCHPDVVVTDLTLGASDGWQLIQDLRRDVRTRAIPVVLLTGRSAPSLRERAEREGCAGFFVKPCPGPDSSERLLGRSAQTMIATTSAFLASPFLPTGK